MKATTTDNLNFQPPPQLLQSLSQMQHEAVFRLAKAEEERGICWWKVGEGKTRIALAWMFYVAQEPRPLIICSPGAFRQWIDEIYLLGIEKELEPKFLSYGMLSRKGRDLVVDFQEYNCLVVDELWLYKNYQSKRSHMLCQITNRLPSIGLSGSMVTARNIEDLYGQAKAMHLDQKIARGMTDFRKQYCIEVANPYHGFIERYPKPKAVEQIQTKLAENIHIYFPKDRIEIRNIDVNVEPTTEQKKIRKELVKTYYYEHQNQHGGGFSLEIKSALTLLIKLQQISDGFLTNEEGSAIHIESSKLHRLSEICAELLDAGEGILIWVAFRHTAKMLCELLPFPILLLSGENEFDAEAWRRGKAKVCVATVGSGASLNDFKDVRYALLYSCRFSHVQMQQAKGRTNRKSSQHTCAYYYHMQTEGFPDREVYRMIEESRSTEEMVIYITNKVIAASNI
jgi:hypothetical protein